MSNIILTDKILNFHDDTLQTVRKSYGLEKNERIDEAIDILEAWLQKQNHFVRKEYPRDYLERALVHAKGSVERTKHLLEKLCTMRTLLPKFFINFRTSNDLELTEGFVHQGLLPKLTPENHRVFIFNFLRSDLSSKQIFSLYRISVMICEYLKAHDYCDGIIAILDYSKMNNLMEFITSLNIVEMRQIITIAMDCYGLRVKGIHMLTSSTAIEMLVKMFKQMVSEKVASRIHVHMDVESLHKHVPKHVMPEEYGGKEGTLKTLHEEWTKVLFSKENIDFLEEMSKACTDESRRQRDTFNEQHLGMPGSFRTLTVD